MGVVWRAEDTVIGRQVAVKELHLPDGVPPAERAVYEERTLREARIAGRLNDPGVVTVHDVVSEQGANYIVMELVEAPTLSDVVRQRGPLPPAQVATIAGQVLSALETAHAAGIVHRDVKPANIMLLPGGRVKLADFGIAQAVDDPRLTQSGTLIGSPAFLAPERVQGGEASPATDLWALGATLFFAVEGVLPFERASTAATLHAILNEVPFPTRVVGPLASVISGLLIASPESRLTGRQVRALLAQAEALERTHQLMVPGQPLAATRQVPFGPSQTQPTPAPRRRWKPLLIAAAVLAVVMLVAGVLLDNYLFHGTPAAPVTAQDSTRTYGGGGTLPEFGLNKGYCANGRLDQGRRFPSSGSVNCKEPHDIEVFANAESFSTSDKVGYPGSDALSRFGEGYCAMVFGSDRITAQDRDTTLKWAAVVPTSDAWQPKDSNSYGAHDVYCVLWRKDQSQLTAPMMAQN
jgi:serine/threonine protein kinase